MNIFWDTETHLIARGNLAPRVVCSSWCVEEDTPHLYPGLGYLRNWLGRGYRLIGANIAYDFACAIAADPSLTEPVLRAYDEGRVVDVQLDAKLLDIAAGEYDKAANAGGWSLETLAARIGLKLEKNDWRLRYAQLDGIPIKHWPEGARKYAMGDALATRAVYQANQATWTVLKESGLDPLTGHSQRAARASFDLHLASCWGVHTSPERVEILAQRTDAYLDRIRKRLVRAKLVRPNGSRDTKAAKAYIERCFAPTPPPLTKKNQISLDRDACILSGSRVLELYSQYVSANLIRGRVERMREGYVYPLQTRFDPLKETGRTSSTQPSPPLVGEQMQNFPRASGTTPAEKKAERAGAYFVGLRECFEPRPGCVFVGADYAQIELCAVAQLCLKLFSYSKLAELINAGVDVHDQLAAITLGLDYAAVHGDRQKYGRDRERAKPGNYGFWGGMGPASFVLYSRKQYDVRFTEDEAGKIKGSWQEMLPETRDYFRWIRRQLGERETFTHVHPITGFVRGGCWHNSGANQGFQHLAAYGSKDAIRDVTNACFRPGPLLGWRMWSFGHDEILLEGPEAGAHEAACRLGTLMVDAMRVWTPDVKIAADPFVTRVWSKKAKAVKVSGRYVPWSPA